MAVPKQHKSKSKTLMRQKAAYKLKTHGAALCSHCGAAVIPHTVCKNCGYYRGRKVLEVKSTVRRKKKGEAKED